MNVIFLKIKPDNFYLKMSAPSVKFIKNIVRSNSTKPSTNVDIRPYVYNRNPRNLERLRIDRKPTGYPLEDVNIEFWHKLQVIPKSAFVVAELIHHTNKVVVTASTNEWAIYKHLNSKKNKMAYIVLAKVFAERCLESGMYSFVCDTVPEESDTKIQAFLKVLMSEGLSLQEAPQFDINNIWKVKREKKPWTVLED